MKSTKPSTTTYAYLGVDFMNWFSNAARPMDFCGCEPKGNTLVAHFWTWCWGSHGQLSVTALLPEVRSARRLMLDGPQGLAQLGSGMRACERRLGAAGKTGETRPPLTQPYGGFINSSLDLFAAFHAAGFLISPKSLLGACEVYPAAIWTRFVQRMPNKRCMAGRQARAELLCALGVALPSRTATHDELDACAAALLGAAADGRVSGVRVIPIGNPVFWDSTYKCHREGPILVPEVNQTVAARLESLVQPWCSMLPRRRPRIARPKLKSTTKVGHAAPIMERPVLAGATREDRAADLFKHLVAALLDGRATLCTYKAAVAMILGYPKFTPAYGKQLTKVAAESAAFEIDGLGEIHLDTFLVNQTYRPGDKHWDHATYSEAEWDRAFIGATVIE